MFAAWDAIYGSYLLGGYRAARELAISMPGVEIEDFTRGLGARSVRVSPGGNPYIGPIFDGSAYELERLLFSMWGVHGIERIDERSTGFTRLWIYAGGDYDPIAVCRIKEAAEHWRPVWVVADVHVVFRAMRRVWSRRYALEQWT